MANHRKGNKGFYGLLVGESLYSSIQAGALLALVNLPMALVAAAIDLSANLISGFLVGPKDATFTELIGAASGDTVQQKKSFLQNTKKFAKNFTKYNASCFKDPDYTVGASAASAGINFFFQGVMGIKSLLATHVISVLPGLAITGLSLPVGFGIATAMTALGIISIAAGNMDKWRGLNKFYHVVFGGQDPKTAAKNVPHSLLKDHLVMRKIFDNKVSKFLKRVLLGFMTIESSLFAITASGSAIFRHVGAMLKSSTAILSSVVPVTWATICGGKGTWQVLSVGRIALRGLLRKISRKLTGSKTARTASTAQPAADLPKPATAVPDAAKNALLEKALADTFEKNAGRDAAKKITVEAPAQAAAKPSRRTPLAPN